MEERQAALETGPYMPGPSGDAPSLPGCSGRLGGLQCKLLTGSMDEMARNSSSCLQQVLWLPRGPAIPGVGTASPLAATGSILQSFPRSNLWFSVAAAFAAGHDSNAQTC